MIRTMIALIPTDRHAMLSLHLCLAVLGVCLRAVGAVLLLPLVAALFGPDPSTVWPWVGLLVAATIVGWINDTVVARLGFELGFGLLDRAQHDVAERLTQVRLGWFTEQNTTAARQAIAATGPELVGLVIYLITPLIGSVGLPVALGIALLPFSWSLGLAALAGVPLLLAAFWLGGRISRASDRVAEQSNSALTERILEFARTQHALRAARRTEPSRSLVGAALAAQHGATVRLLLMQIPGQLIFGLAGQLALLILAGTATWVTVGGGISVPTAIAFLVVIARYLEPFTALADLSTAIESTGLTLRRIRTVLRAPATEGGPTASKAISAAGPPRIEFRGVSFAYRPDRPAVLTDLDLDLEPGTTTAIVGPSGSGKSTVLALAAGLQQPTAGRVMINGTDLFELPPAHRHRLSSVIFQQPYLFDGSIEDNIRAGHPDADADALAAVTALAEVDELTSRLPEGLGTHVGEAGGTLSGGERQRVSIARALLKPAPLLLVDEATSALDNKNQAAIVSALTADPLPRTRVVVAHRLASIVGADRVLFLDDGKIIEDGTVDQLLALGGRFAQFWQAQQVSSHWQLAHTGPTGI